MQMHKETLPISERMYARLLKKSKEEGLTVQAYMERLTKEELNWIESLKKGDK